MQFNLVGLKFRPAPAKKAFQLLSAGDEVELIREPHNAFDLNAIQVSTADGYHIGYVPAPVAADLAPILDEMEGPFYAHIDTLLPPWSASITFDAEGV